MRHRRRTRKLGRKTAHRQIMLRNMVTSLLEHGRITTTVPRAREVRRIADRMVSLAKDGSLHARRKALSVIMDKAVVHRLFTHWAEKMSEKRGGYTRIVKIGPRRGDAAMMCYLEMATDVLEKAKARPRPERETREAEEPSVIPQAPQPAGTGVSSAPEQAGEPGTGEAAGGDVTLDEEAETPEDVDVATEKVEPQDENEGK